MTPEAAWAASEREFGGVDQYAVVAQQAALGPHHLHQELDHRGRQRLAGGHPQHALATGVDHRGEGQVVEVRLAFDPGLAELFGRRQAGHHFGGSEVTHIEQFDLGIQRLVLPRLEGQLAQPQRMRHTEDSADAAAIANTSLRIRSMTSSFV
ncbi:hypothetical protein NWF32_15405 [Pseudomonas qingdaonensis]|nr:hypothetical protein [Pseudomonas qingdaonensis]